MGKLPTLLLTCVVSLVCGSLGALATVTVFQDQLVGPQGPSGLAGAPGKPGPPGVDGADGANGARGPRGRPGPAAAPVAPQPVNLGSVGCRGRSVDVVTNVTVLGQKMQLEKHPVCVTR
ncbi:MAG: hypothetical protein ACXVXC_15080 [Nocardioidaceae bacterium]